MEARTPATFRKFLDVNGVSDLIAKALAQLYEKHEQSKDPEDPLEYLRKLISSEGNANMEAQLTKLKEENAKLLKANEDQAKKIAELEASLAKVVEEREVRKAESLGVLPQASIASVDVAPTIVSEVVIAKDESEDTPSSSVVAEENEGDVDESNKLVSE